MIIKNVSAFIVTDKDLYWISKDNVLNKNEIKIGISKSYADLIYANDTLYITDGENLQVIPENKKINLNRSIFDIQKNIVFFYSGGFMNKTFGIAQLNDKNQTKILLETKKVEIHKVHNNFVIGTDEKGIVCLNFQDEILWQFPLLSLGGSVYAPDKTDEIDKILGIAHGKVWFYSRFGRLVALNLETGNVIKKISGNPSDQNSSYEMTLGLGDCFFRNLDKNIVSISGFDFQIIDTKTLTIKEQYNFLEADPTGIGAYRSVFSPLLQGDYFTFLGEKEKEYGGIGWGGIFDYKARKLIWEYEVISQEERNQTRNQLVTSQPLHMSDNRLYIKDMEDNLHIFEREDV